MYEEVDEEAEQGRGGGGSSETPSPSLQESHFIRWLYFVLPPTLRGTIPSTWTMKIPHI